MSSLHSELALGHSELALEQVSLEQVSLGHSELALEQLVLATLSLRLSLRGDCAHW